MGIKTPLHSQFLDKHNNNSSNPMSQDYHHQGIFSFSNGFERQQQQQQQQQQHIAQQIRRDNKLSVHGFMEEEETGGLPVYETGGAGTMMSEIFNFPSDGAVSATELLETQISQSYRNSRAAPPTSAADWFSHSQSINADSEAAMQLFPTPPHSTSFTLHMLLPNPSSSSSFGQFTWFNPNENNNINNPNEIPGVVEGQRLSLSLSSSLQHMGGGGGLHSHGGVSHSRHQSSNFTAANMLRNSKYAKAAQDLLEEFCSVGRGQFKKRPNNNRNPSGGGAAGGGGGAAGDENAAQDHPPLSASDRLEHQRRKVKLLAMLDEVDRRYNHYCEQMQMVVNSFDMMMGFGAAAPYTSLAQKAMSRHFRCLKDAISAQLKQSCELLGEKDGAGTSGVTKGETPRLRILEQSLRQQRAFQQMGIMEQEAWRPQRGLPERSVNVLRAWLFEHFLHPYPSDADKHLLARQTGLSRNQVSNWFINARVRLWKPMVEDMYQQEAKDETQEQEKDQTSSSTSSPDNDAQIPTPPTTTATGTGTTTFTPSPAGKRPQINAHENDPSLVAINAHFFSENQANYNSVPVPAGGGATSSAAAQSFPAALHETDTWRKHSMNRFGTSGGDVSLTLGLRHGAGNLPEKSHNFSVTDFGGLLRD